MHDYTAVDTELYLEGQNHKDMRYILSIQISYDDPYMVYSWRWMWIQDAWNWSQKNEFPSDKKGAEGESDGNVEAEKAGDHLDLLKMLLICS